MWLPRGSWKALSPAPFRKLTTSKKEPISSCFATIRNSAPYIVEIKGADKYLKEEAIKFVMNFQKKVTSFQRSLNYNAIESSKSKAAAAAIVVKREL